jgi:hypothetical protein
MGGVLASLLPGLRDLRAPLAAGYVWLGVVWVAWGRNQTGLAEEPGLAGDVYRLGKSAGPLATAAALSFVAYLIGILAIAVGAMVIQGGAWIFLTSPIARLESWPFVPAERRAALRATAQTRTPFVQDRAERLIWDRYRGLGKDELSRWSVRLAEDLRLVPFRLIGKEPELYGEYDRLRSEAEFRLAVSGPLLVLITLLASSFSLWWAFALPMPIFLLYTGVQQQRAADDVLFDAIRAGRVESPVLTALDAQMEAREARGDRNNDDDDGRAGVGARPKP